MTYKYGDAYSSDELQYFEEASFRNMVDFYREELHQLIRGGMAKSIFTKGDRRVLRRLGILQLKGTGKSGRRLVITSKARNLL